MKPRRAASSGPIAALLSLCALASCDHPPAEPASPTPEVAVPASEGSSPPPVWGEVTEAASEASPAPPVVFRTDVDQAVEDARAQGRGVVLFFRAAWDMSSMELEKKTFPDAGVQKELAARFIAVTVDATDSDEPAVDKVISSYSVKGVPTVILLDAAGNEVKRFMQLTDAATLRKALSAVRTKAVPAPVPAPP